jgi:predicted transposase/invertase (TIGR01784 family)
MAHKIIRFDWALKKLLRNKANYEILEGFVSVLLKQDIRIDNITESDSNKEDERDKYNSVDIFAETSTKELIIIELQVDNEVDYFQRMAYGASKALAQHLDAGDEYMKVRKVYSINIVYFDLGQGQDYVYHGITEFRGLHHGDVLQLSERQRNIMPFKAVSDIYPEYYVLKINTFNDVAADDIDEWMYALKHSEVKDEFHARGLDKLRDKLNYENMTTQQKQNYDEYIAGLSNKKSELLTSRIEGRAEGLVEGEQIGLEKGEQIGIQKGLLRKGLLTALKCLRRGMSVEETADFVELPSKTIQLLGDFLAKNGDDAENHLDDFVARFP